MTARAICVLATALVASPAALAHAFLDHASPAVGSQVRGAPTTVTLWFTEEIEPTFSSVKVLDAHGQEVDRGDKGTDRSDPTALRVGLKPLGPGAYRVEWRAVSVDTHVTTGDFTFTVQP